MKIQQDLTQSNPPALLLSVCTYSKQMNNIVEKQNHCQHFKSRTSGLVWRGIKEELPAEPGRVRRGVDRETDGPRVVEDFIVVSTV